MTAVAGKRRIGLDRTTGAGVAIVVALLVLATVAPFISAGNPETMDFNAMDLPG